MHIAHSRAIAAALVALSTCAGATRAALARRPELRRVAVASTTHATPAALATPEIARTALLAAD